MYHKKVIDLFLSPQNVGEIVKPDAKIEVENACGSVVKLYLRIENNVIKDAKFKAFGCPVTIAACSLATGMIVNETIEEAKELPFERILVEMVTIPEEKIGCVQAVVNAVIQVIEVYEKKQKKLEKKQA